MRKKFLAAFILLSACSLGPARAEDAAEGDGWLLAVVWRAGENRSDLAVFNATDVEPGPVALVQLGHRVPDGFHGNWVAAAQAKPDIRTAR